MTKKTAQQILKLNVRFDMSACDEILLIAYLEKALIHEYVDR
jgi:hypothetical protein